MTSDCLLYISGRLVHGSDVDPTSRLILQSTSRSVTSLLPRLERLEAGDDPRNDVVQLLKTYVSEGIFDYMSLGIFYYEIFIDIIECTYLTTFSFYIMPFSHCKDLSWVLLGRYRTSFNLVIPSPIFEQR